MGITEILRRIWLFSANKIKISESFSKKPTQLIIAARNCHTRTLFLCKKNPVRFHVEFGSIVVYLLSYSPYPSVLDF